MYRPIACISKLFFFIPCQAFLTALRLRKSTDLLEVVHVYDPHASVPHHLKPEEVKLRYETELVSKVPSEHYRLTW